MNNNIKLMRSTAMVMTGVLLAGGINVSALAADAKIEKEETVYVKAEPDGSVADVIVSDWLKNLEGADTLELISDLSGIENVKGEESFTQSGDKLIWSAGGSDIYYQGKTDKELPVSVEITYYLDGQKIDPAQLAGKSGHVRIVFSYKNTSKTGDIYTPFVMATGMILPQEKFSNVEVTNGRLVSDGEKEVVVGLGAPGMNDSLSLQDSELMKELDISFPESFEIEADVTDFELAMSMTVATSLDLSDLDLDDVKDKDDLQNKIHELKDGATQLVDGSHELADGVQELKDSCQELIDGMNRVDEGMGTLNDGIGTLNTKKQDLISGIDQLADGIYTMNGSKGTLVAGVNALADGAKALDDGAGVLYNGINGTKKNPGLLAGATQLAAGLDMLAESVLAQDNAASLSNGIVQLKAGAAQLLAAVEGQAMPGVTALQAGVDQLIAAVGDASSAQTLRGGVAALQAGLTELSGKFTQVAQKLPEAQQAIDGIAGEQALGAVLTGIDGYLTAGTAAAQEQPAQTASEARTVAAEVEVSAAQAAPDAAAQLEASLAANRNVLASLYNVKSTAGAVTLPESMEALAGTYNSYVGELDSCIAQLEAAVAAQEAALAAMQATTTQTVEVAVLQEAYAGETAPAVDNGGATDAAVSVKASDLATWKAILTASQSGLTTLSGELQTASGAIQGSGQNPGLAAAVSAMDEGLTKLGSGLDQVKQGLSSGSAQAPGLKEGLAALQAGTASGSMEAPGLKEGLEQLLAGLDTLESGVDTTLAGGIRQLQAGSHALADGAGELKDGAKALKGGTGELAAGTKTLQGGTGTLADGVGRLAQGAGQLQAGAGTLASGVQELADGSQTLKDGTAELAEGGGALEEGVDKLNDGAGELRDGIDEFDEKAIQKITDILENDLQEFLDRLEDIKKAGANYRSFSEAGDMDGDVEFIIETGGIGEDW